MPSTPQQRQLRNSMRRADYLKDALRNLRAEGFDLSDVRSDADGLLRLNITKRFDGCPELPEGYALKGGAARWLLEENLGIGAGLPPRDLDLIRLKEITPDGTQDHLLSATYMPDDYHHQHGVEIVKDRQAWFRSHDFNVNEVYADGRELVFSPFCLRGTLRRELGFSPAKAEPKQQNRLVPKAIRLQLESGFTQAGSYRFKQEIRKAVQRCQGNAAFTLAVELDKAFSRGQDYAEAYVDELADQGILPQKIATPMDAVAWVSRQHPGYDWKYLLRNPEPTVTDAVLRGRAADVGERGL
jgi:hypothetical protein